MPRWSVWGLIILLAACGSSSPFPNMEPGETGRVVRIIDGDALVLESGQSVRLVSIEAPALYPRDRPADPHAAESARVLEELALGRQVQLYYPGITRDRYDRALAHVRATDGSGPAVWLNHEMIARGAAWVRLYPDTSARGDELLALERTAQDAQLGIWGRPDYAVSDAGSVSAEERGFRLVRARLSAAIEINEETRYPPACLRTLEGSELQLRIRRAARTACGLANGTPVMVRGYISELQLDLTYPRHLQVLAPD